MNGLFWWYSGFERRLEVYLDRPFHIRLPKAAFFDTQDIRINGRRFERSMSQPTLHRCGATFDWNAVTPNLCRNPLGMALPPP
jgi:hypothetical protein